MSGMQFLDLSTGKPLTGVSVARLSRYPNHIQDALKLRRNSYPSMDGVSGRLVISAQASLNTLSTSTSGTVVPETSTRQGIRRLVAREYHFTDLMCPLHFFK